MNYSLLTNTRIESPVTTGLMIMSLVAAVTIGIYATLKINDFEIQLESLRNAENERILVYERCARVCVSSFFSMNYYICKQK